MEFINGETDVSELLQAQAHIWNHTFQFINSMSLKCAVEMEIPDKIHDHGGPMCLSDLVASLNIPSSKSQYIYRLMRILTHSGFFTNSDGQGYLLTPTSRLLVKNNPFSVRNFVLLLLDPVLMNPSNCLSSFLQTDKHTNPFEIFHGVPFWECASKDSRLLNLVHDGMVNDSVLISTIVSHKYKWVFEGMKSLVDVAGSTGTNCKIIAKAFPEMDCTVFDLPQVVSGLQGSKNLKFVAGNMFESVPPADVVMLKWASHDWSDEELLKLLMQCKKAAKKKFIIIDMVVGHQNPDKKSTETQLFFDMVSMMVLTGKERTEKELAKLFFAVGFSRYKIHPVLGLRALIEVYP